VVAATARFQIVLTPIGGPHRNNRCCMAWIHDGLLIYGWDHYLGAMPRFDISFYDFKADTRRPEEMDMETDLSGRIAVVTGAGSGLGAAMCRKFAAVGAAVAALDIDSENAAATAKLLGAEFGIPTLSQEVDVADRKSLAEAASQIEAELGGCDVLCANVGVQQIGAIDRLSDDDWTWLINVNVLGTVRTVSAFLPLIRRRSGWRRIVLTSSSSALLPSVRLAAYQSSKFAVWGFGDSLRRELAEEGIGVTVIFPAGMPTRHLESSALARPPDKGEDLDSPRRTWNSVGVVYVTSITHLS
jgi:NAD(P)-dependent dehydrogenase (short-subunit alcohol dehydrogenase family)